MAGTMVALTVVASVDMKVIETVGSMADMMAGETVDSMDYVKAA